MIVYVVLNYLPPSIARTNKPTATNHERNMTMTAKTIGFIGVGFNPKSAVGMTPGIHFFH